MLKTTFGDAAIDKTRVGFTFKECQLKTKLIHTLLLQELTKTLTKSMPSLVLTVAEPSMNSVRWNRMELNSEEIIQRFAHEKKRSRSQVKHQGRTHLFLRMCCACAVCYPGSNCELEVFRGYEKLEGQCSDEKCRRTGDWLFHPNNVPAHTAISIKQFLNKKGVKPIVHPHY